ncbi:MAG: spore cortex biosynthesis protein YabQ [Ruminococcus sp.]|nr:spore cortex biosynthesis protein YabQ [Ruminococcus sp.]
MTFTLSDQLLCFGCSVLCGIGLGVLYELFRFIRLFADSGRISVFICDLLFMIISALVTVLFSICYSKGATRYYTVLGELAGLLAVRFTLGRLCIGFLVPLSLKVKQKISKIAVNMVKLAKKLLQVITNILYNNIRKKGPVSSDGAVYEHTE